MDNGRDNLVLVNAFYTNSVILKGLIDFLGETFNVYFIDLPGFSIDSPPLEKVDLENFARYVRRRVDDWGLEHFLIGGISFGFLVANSLPLNGQCRGLVAITPFIGDKSLKMNPLKKGAYRAVTGLFSKTGLAGHAWKTEALRRFALWYSHYPPDRVNLILDHMDGQTFFETGRLILKNTPLCTFHDLPYILIVSRNDVTIDSDFVVRRFQENVERLLIVEASFDHYPADITKEYFRERFGPDDMDRVSAFIRSHRQK